MKTTKRKFILILAACITVIEALYHITFTCYLKLSINYFCDYVGSSIKDAIAHYQFRYVPKCKELEKTLLDFINPADLINLDRNTTSLIETINRYPQEPSYSFQFWYFLETIQLVLNITHIATSIVLFYESVSIATYFKYTTLPWIVVTFIVAIIDVTDLVYYMFVYLICLVPSKCILWHVSSFIFVTELEDLDQYAYAGTPLYDTVTYMPLRYLLLACKHLIGIPILIILAVAFIRERKALKIDKHLYREENFVVIDK